MNYDVLRLEEVAEVFDCPHSSPKWTDDGIPVIRNYNLVDGHIDQSKLSFTDDECYVDRIKRAVPDSEDIVLSREAPMGRVGMIPDNFKCCLGQRLVLLKVKRNVCIPHWFLYCLQSDYVQEQIKSYDNIGTTVSNLGISTIKDLKIPVPSFEYQKHVVDVIKPNNDLIAINCKINDYLFELANVIFNHFIEPACSKMLFEDLITLGSGGTPKTSVPEYWGGQIPFFSPKDVSGCYVYKTEKNITQDGLDNCNSNLYPPNTTFITARGTVGKICLTAKPMAMNQSCYAVLSKNGTSYTTYLMCNYIVKRLKQKASGAVFDAITAQDILKEEIPSIDYATAIELESTLSPIFNMILKNGEESERLIQIRDCIMKVLFVSGS